MKLTPDERFERALDAKHRRRLAAEDRFLAKREKQEAAADVKIGELLRDGKTVYYVTVPDGHVHPRLRTIEKTNRQELVEFLIRNHYV